MIQGNTGKKNPQMSVDGVHVINKVTWKSATLGSVMACCLGSFNLISREHKFITVPVFLKEQFIKKAPQNSFCPLIKNNKVYKLIFKYYFIFSQSS